MVVVVVEEVIITPLSTNRFIKFFFRLYVKTYPASRAFALAWLLAFTKSFAWLVCRVVGLFTQLSDRQATRLRKR